MRVFDPNEILINIVPGGIIIFTFLYLTENIEYITTSTSILLIGLFIVVSFVLVEASTEISDQPNWYPYLFTDTVILSRDPDRAKQESNQRSALAGRMPNFRAVDRIDLTHSKKEFWPIAKNKYGLSDSFDDYVELYRLIMHSLEPLNGRTRRVQRLYAFYRNLAISMALVCIMLLYAFISLISGEFTLSVGVVLFSFLFLSFVVIFFIVLVIFLWRRSRRAEQEFLNELMSEFYEQEYRENNGRQNRTLSEYE